MNTVWSEQIQGVQTLYLSRKLRFDDLFFEQYQSVFGIEKDTKIKILEVGCGPGALAESLHRWYPNAEIVAVDRDVNFLEYGSRHVAGVRFVEGDAAHLPFADGSFDVTISNTVQEHVEPDAFWGEQRRVLTSGGICLCLSARRGLCCTAPCLAQTEAEERFWNGINSENEREKYGVGRYAVSEAELAAGMERHGFENVTTGYAVIDLTPDDPKYSAPMAERMIEAQRQTNLEAIASAHSDQDAEAVAAVNAKYGERLRLYRAGIKQWDTSVSVTMILRGEKHV